MSDFVSQDIFPDLWKDILEKHWTYLETEECIAKLEKRKKLEDYLKEFLCTVQHDRKFILSDTARVLKNSMRDLPHFSAQNGINAFESISQYANNLFTKPWRKEFRDLKLYSGFYQHEIKSNLVDAEILFEAMGYRRLTEDTLILDGPICPDQVANVSRDAMIAYVELQIIKHIYTGLETIGINYSWLDIYYYREKTTGGPSQAIKALANIFEEKRFRSGQKLLFGDNSDYIDAQPSSNYYSAGSQFCPAECQCSLYQQVNHMSRQRPAATCANGVCCVPERQKQSLTAMNSVYSNMPFSGQQHDQYSHQQHHPGLSTENGGVLLSLMSHSRSLDHYGEHPNHYNNLLPHRHSFDHQQQGCTAHHHPLHNTQQQKIQQQQEQQQRQQNYYQHLNKVQHNFYESPYDCIDGNSLGGDSSNISYAPVAANIGAGIPSGGIGANCSLNPNPTYSHPYNVSGNRIPLPFNISNQLFYENPQSSNYNDVQEPTYAHITEQNMYSLKSKLPQNFAKNPSLYSNPNNNQSSQNPINPLMGKDFLQRQHSCQPQQIINFDDASILQHSPLQQPFDPANQFHTNYDTLNHLTDKHYNMQSNREKSLSLSTSSAISQQDCDHGKPPANDEPYVYAKPIPRESRKQNTSTLRKYTYNNGETTDISYESANDDIVNLPITEMEWNRQSPAALSSKNQDGVGSAEFWSNVYHNAEKKGHSKEVGERADLLVQSLDLDSLNINNDTAASQTSSIDKRRSLYSGNENKTAEPHEQQQQKQQSETKFKSKTFENAKYLTKNNSKADKVSSSSSSTNHIQKQKASLDNNTKKAKSAPKQTNSTSKPNTSINKSQTKSYDNKSLPKTVAHNNNNELIDLSGRSSTQHKKLLPGGNPAKKGPAAAAMQIIVTSDNEWSCHFCTFINPNSKRVCEMCCHSKDFKLDSSSSTAAGTTTVAQNTPTCA